MMLPALNLHFLILRTYECYLIYGKRDFADGIESRILRRGGYAQLSGLAKCYHNSLYKKETGRMRERGVRTEAEMK